MDNYREYGQGSADAIREEYLRKEREKREQQAEYEESMRDVFNQRKEQSQKAYNELADIFHPDHGGNSDLMKKLNEAHEIAIRQGDFSILNALHQRYARKIERRKKERELYSQRKEQTAKVYRRLSDILHPSRGGSAEKL
ncbi:MAG: hypothetical protein NT148_01695, partial [Candidatus Nealsonbacteria bacterium]|nr:hypothetical protein [Candidatus Nealsonbacteria bacterium]